MDKTTINPRFSFAELPVESPFMWGLSDLLVQESSNILERLTEKEYVVEDQMAQFKWSK